MQVEGVELIMGHRVDLLLDVGFVEEVARDVEHQSAPAIAGCILDFAAGHAAVGTAQLAQRLQSIEESCARNGLDGDG